MSQGKKNTSRRAQRNIRIQQIIFATIAIVVILSWVIGMIAN